MAMPTGSASQNPCGWPETRRRKGGEIMSTKASTAALDRFGQRLLLPGDAFRATRLAVRIVSRELTLRRDSRIQENDHAQFDSGSKQRARQKDCKKPLPADPRHHAACGLRVCRASGCLRVARAAS